MILLLLPLFPVASRAEPANKIWACDTTAKMSACFEVEDAELARKSDTGQTGRELLGMVCDVGGGKLVVGTCPATGTAGTCLQTKGLGKPFYAKGAAPDHYTFAGHYYTTGEHPSDGDDERRCAGNGGVWHKGFVALAKAPKP
jgi:hypothetical protein